MVKPRTGAAADRSYRQRARRGSGDAPQVSLHELLEGPFLAAMPYLMLVVSLALTAITPASRPALPAVLALAAGLTGWTLWLYALHPAWRERHGLMAVFLAVLLAATAALVVIDPFAGFFAYACYFYVYWSAAGVFRAIALCVVGVMVGTSQTGGLPWRVGTPIPVWLIICLLDVGVGSAIFWFAARSDAQSEHRRKLVAQLSEANGKLADSLQENTGLHAQLVVQAREAGVADERQRMAREIHDTIAQGLAGIITQLQAAERAEQAGLASEHHRHLDAAAELARDSLTEARQSVHALRPQLLQEARLADALGEVVRRWSTLHGIEATVTVTGTPLPLRPDTELALLRVAQEALANVAKHARAARTGLTLSYMQDQVTLDVRDDGVGFAPDTQAVPVAPAEQASPAWPDSGFGLTTMHERVEGLGGSLAIESEPGAGTAISASVPTDEFVAPVSVS
ncbi:MAG TPA: sensor histidine kinase [Streptosporangiaceae bacterium]